MINVKRVKRLMVEPLKVKGVKGLIYDFEPLNIEPLNIEPRDDVFCAVLDTKYTSHAHVEAISNVKRLKMVCGKYEPLNIEHSWIKCFSPDPLSGSEKGKRGESTAGSKAVILKRRNSFRLIKTLVPKLKRIIRHGYIDPWMVPKAGGLVNV